ncbi:MAG: amidohydrolase family protein [Sphingomicrobium sp.]|nr:amidohydrolase family protein [Sphingomonadales bacterium]
MHRMVSAIILALLATTPVTARVVEPIIDMHMHALKADDQGTPPLAMCTPIVAMPVWDQRVPYAKIFMERLKHPPCPDPVWSPTTDDALMRESIGDMDRFNIIGMVSGSPERVAAWRKARPARVIPGLVFQLEPELTPAKIEAMHAAGELAVLGEVTTQYAGVAPTDPRLEPYWALAEKLDIPVQIHVGTGPPGVIYLGAEGYRARLHSALTMEEVLVKHPHLRVYLAHAGYPMIDDLLALLYAHPQVYVDTGVIVFTQPRAAFYRYLQRIEEAGFGKRVMFGSDQMVWPGVLGRSIKVIQEAPFLSAADKRDILYNNAARFLRLTPEQIVAHRRLGGAR